MSIPASDSARIAQHVYANAEDPTPFREGETLQIKGTDREYRILKIVDDPETGYQGAIYQNTATGELVVAHRGTEPERDFVADMTTNAGMVLDRLNRQTPHAEALTQEAMRMAKDPEQWPDGVTSEPAVLHAGHSLGGFHAQDRAAEHGQGGASFNGFGAAGIGRAPAGIVEGAPAFTSHVRATDMVGLSSRHYGDVVMYATAEDVAFATGPRRPGTEGPTGFLGNAVQDFGARHSIASFAEGGLMSAANRERYLDHQPLFEEHQRAVHSGREWATYGGDVTNVATKVAAATIATAPGSPAQRVIVGGISGAIAAASVNRPEVPEPLQRIEGDVIRRSLELRAGLKGVDADITEGSARLNAGLNDFVETTGRGVKQTIGAVKGHVSSAVDDLGDLGAEAHRHWGEANQRVANLQADVLDAVGLDGLAERQRAKGLDARVDAENAALDIERGAKDLGGIVDNVGRRVSDAAQGVTDAVSTPIENLAARHQSNAAEARAEAQGLRQSAAVIPEMLYGAAAPNLDLQATAREKITALYSEHDRPPPTPEQLDRMSAAMVADARGQGMKRIQEVMFSQGDNAPDFNGKLICFDGVAGGDHTRYACTPIAKAQETPVEQSVDRTRAANERQEQFQLEIQKMQARDQAMQESQGMSMRIGARTMDGPGEGAAAGGGDGGG
jgi:hypothetical protein